MARGILAVVRARAKELGLSAYAIAKLTDGEVSKDTVNRFLKGDGPMSSSNLERVFAVLKLKVVAAEDE